METHTKQPDSKAASFREQVIAAMQDATKLFEAKNRNYGDAWRRSGEILHTLLPPGFQLNKGEARIPQLISIGLLTRLCDKFCRAGQLLAGDADLVDEALTDTLQDAGAYCFMLATAANYNPVPDTTHREDTLIHEPNEPTTTININEMDAPELAAVFAEAVLASLENLFDSGPASEYAAVSVLPVIELLAGKVLPLSGDEEQNRQQYEILRTHAKVRLAEAFEADCRDELETRRTGNAGMEGETK